MDLFSRQIAGWQVYDYESAELASQLIQAICERQGITPDQLTVHEQPPESVRWVKPHQRPTLRITRPCSDVPCHHQPGLGRFRYQEAGLIGCEGIVALPTATYPSS